MIYGYIFSFLGVLVVSINSMGQEHVGIRRLPVAGPDRSDARLSTLDQGNAHYQRGDYGLARSCYELVTQGENKQEKAHAWVQLGNLYFLGHLGRDYDKARYYYALAEKQDDNKKAKAAAWVSLAKMYHMGEGVSLDHDRACFYYELAEKQEDNTYAQAEACIYIGSMYCDGNTITKVAAREKARSYYERAAKQTENGWARAEAWLWLGKYYSRGDQEDETRMCAFYDLAAKQNENDSARAEALEQLGHHYDAESEDAESERARHYFELAASQNDNASVRKQAYASLSAMYYWGREGIEVDQMRALTYADLAKRLGFYLDAYKEAKELWYKQANCSFCLKDVKGDCTRRWCGHMFHRECWDGEKGLCPNCRMDSR